MAREADTTWLPDAREDRVIECPVCSNAMTTMTAEGVTVDVCAGGCGGIWFDWFELARVDEAKSAGESSSRWSGIPNSVLTLASASVVPGTVRS